MYEIIILLEKLNFSKNEVAVHIDLLKSLSSNGYKIAKKGVRIIIFSFKKCIVENIPMEIYNHFSSNCDELYKTLVADRGPHREEILGVFTDNILLASIIYEHIHNDIYTF